MRRREAVRTDHAKPHPYRQGEAASAPTSESASAPTGDFRAG
jgi:hypothetical protein